MWKYLEILRKYECFLGNFLHAHEFIKGEKCFYKNKED